MTEFVYNGLSCFKIQEGAITAENWVSVCTGSLRSKEMVEMTCLGYWVGESLKSQVWKSDFWWQRLKQIDGHGQIATNVGTMTSYFKADRAACRSCLHWFCFTSFLCNSKCISHNFLMMVVAGSCCFSPVRRYSSGYFLLQHQVSGAEVWGHAFAWQNYVLSLCVDVSNAVCTHVQMAKLSIYMEERCTALQGDESKHLQIVTESAMSYKACETLGKFRVLMCNVVIPVFILRPSGGRKNMISLSLYMKLTEFMYNGWL